jgi:hypothetical protein
VLEVAAAVNGKLAGEENSTPLDPMLYSVFAVPWAR